MQILSFILIGLMAGILSGLTGIGGGIVVVPLLVYFFGYSQHLAQGTTLALMVPPIGILAAWGYYQKGYVNLTAAAIIAIGFIAGGFLGSKFALNLPEVAIRRIFAGLLVIVAIKMFLQKPSGS